VNTSQNTAASRPPATPDQDDRGALSRPLLVALFTIAIGLALVGLIAELRYAKGELSADATHFLSLSAESNLPTWHATCLLFWCAQLLFENGQSARAQAQPRALTWYLLAVVFLFMSLDEAVEIHEHLGSLVEGHGLLYFSWVIPAFAFVLTVGAASVPFLFALPRQTRYRFIASGALYVGGALGMELPLGLWVEQHGDDNFTYAALDLIEETLELLGASLFVVALEAHLRVLRAPRTPA